MSYSILEKKGDKAEYDRFFRMALKKFGVSDPSQLSKEKKKEFFNYVDKNYIGDHEETNPQAESVEYSDSDLEEGIVRKAKYAVKRSGAAAGTAAAIGGALAARAIAKRATKEGRAKLRAKSAEKKAARAQEYQSNLEREKSAKQATKDARQRASELERERKMRKENYELNEKSVSQKQQRLMAMAYQYKMGNMKNASPSIKKLANSMSKDDLKDFASTKRKGLPVTKNVKEAVEIDARKKSFKETMKRLDSRKTKMAQKKQEETKKNTIIINPEVKESNAYNFVKKYKEKQRLREYSDYQNNQSLQEIDFGKIKQSIITNANMIKILVSSIKPLFKLIAAMKNDAKESIILYSSYLTLHFAPLLKEAEDNAYEIKEAAFWSSNYNVKDNASEIKKKYEKFMKSQAGKNLQVGVSAAINIYIIYKFIKAVNTGDYRSAALMVQAIIGGLMKLRKQVQNEMMVGGLKNMANKPNEYSESTEYDNILMYIAEKSFSAYGTDIMHDAHGETDDKPATALRIARAFRMSIEQTQQLLDQMEGDGIIEKHPYHGYTYNLQNGDSLE